MMNNRSFTKEDLLQAIKRIEMPLVTFEPLEKYLAQGGKMKENLTMVTAQEAYKDISEINTIHGILKIQYNSCVPTETIYFMSLPNFDDWLKPNFKIFEDKPST